MTSLIVVDASAFIALLFDEPEGADVVGRLVGRSFLAPTLLRYEVANVTLMKMRRHPDQARLLLLAHEKFSLVPIEFAEVDHVAVLALAQRRNLTAYDASYVWLALSRGVELVSLDRRMLAAFEAEAASIG